MKRVNGQEKQAAEAEFAGRNMDADVRYTSTSGHS